MTGPADPLIAALLRAVESSPDDVELRLHLGELLLARSDADGAIEQASAVLASSPGDERGRRLMTDALRHGTPVADPAGASQPGADAADATSPDPGAGFDWRSAEAELRGAGIPSFVPVTRRPDDLPVAPAEVERSRITLADVGGMQAVKDRLTAAFLAPLQNPELRALYGKSLRGGLLMYGPPGCGKTFIARAVAGELGAGFLTVGLTDVLDPYQGQSERNVHELFQLARRQAPCVVFIDEIDAIGQRRSLNRGSSIRSVVVALLEELDGVASDNDGVFVLAATNQPWDVDPALRRPGRLDRTVLVLPPDAAARAAIFTHHLAGRPVQTDGPSAIDTALLARESEGLSGADVAYACELASEAALLDSVASGRARPIGMPDLLSALRQVPPSTGPWLDSARNVVLFGEDDGTFAELKAYLKRAKRL